MKIFRSTAWFGLVLAAPGVAAAQVTVSDNVTDAQRNEIPRRTLTLDGSATHRANGTSGDALTPEFHTVQRGDTLWDITGNYFQNPWNWPMIWGRNPQITNPHWIFPGDQVRLMLSGQRSASPAASQRLSSNSVVQVGPRMPRGTVFLREEAWATPEALTASGSIVGAPEDTMMLAEGDQIYVQFDRRAPNVGETYTIYQDGQQTQGADRDAGRVVRVLGTVVVDAWDRERHIATGRVIESIEPIERGEHVAIVQRQFEPSAPTTNDRDLLAHVVAMPQPRLIVGANYVVIIDRGQQDGVRLGNRFFLTSRGDPMMQSVRNNGHISRLTLDRDGDGIPDQPPTNPDPADTQLPVEVTGELQVVAVHPRTAVCIVVGTIREVEVGAPLVMRRGY
jgi:hypothetical protein